MTWLVLGGGVVVIVLAILLSRARVPHDGVDSFRRQIDALSPEARRPVVGQVNEAREAQRDDGLTKRPVTSVTPAGGIKRGPNDANQPADELADEPGSDEADDAKAVNEADPSSPRPDADEDAADGA